MGTSKMNHARTNRTARILGFLTLGFLTLGVALLANSSQASEVCVAQATGPGIANAQLQTVTDLVRSAVGEAGSSVVAPDNAANCSITLRPKLLKLDSATILSIEKWEESRMTFSTQLKAIWV
jgi:hypothetical protein